MHRGTDVGQGVATVMNGPVENMAESNGLNVQVQTQAATIRTLRTLLEQYRQENEQLHTVASVGGPVEAHVPVSKENAPEPNHLLLRGHDMERKLRETESLAMKLAIQVRALDTDKRTADNVLASLKTKVKAVTCARDVAQSRSVALEKDLDRIREELQRSSKRLGDSTAKVAMAHQKISELESQLLERVPISDMNAKVSRLREELEEAILAKEQSADCIDRLSAEIETLRAQMSTVSARTHDESAKHTRALADLNNATDELHSVRQQIESMRSEYAMRERAHIEDMESLKRAHQLTQSLSEQSSASAIIKLEGKLRIATETVVLLEARICELTKEQVDLKSEVLRAKLVWQLKESQSVQAVVAMHDKPCQSDCSKVRTVGTGTDSCVILSEECYAEVTKAVSCMQCETARPSAISTLFPCGHGVCSDCLSTLIASDGALGGFPCEACGDNLPVTRICNNRPLADLSRLLGTSVEHLSG